MGDHGAGGGEGSAQVTLRPDGAIVLGTPIFDQGTGTYTTLTQVVAEELQVPTSRIELDIWDTDAIESDSGIGGSRATRVNTAAAYEAVQDAKRALVALLAQRLGASEDAVVLRGDDVELPGEAPRRWADVLAEAGESVSGSSRVDERAPTNVTGFAAQVAEVSVDPETGQVHVLRFTTAHDVGRILNPVGHQGQINGGVIQGLGYALMEELSVEDGQVTSLSFGDYKIPTIRDVPPLQTVLIESDGGVGPYQIKSIGETPNTPVAAAIANAVADAVGVRVRDLPITAGEGVPGAAAARRELTIVRLTVNARPVEADVPARRTLVDLLRYDLGLPGTKEACGVGVCGACTVMLNGRMVASCITLAAQAEDGEVLTIEGLAERPGEGSGDAERLDPLQQSFIRLGGFQCGICTPGQLMAARALLDANPSPSKGRDRAVDDGQPLPLHRLLPDPRLDRRGSAGRRALVLTGVSRR